MKSRLYIILILIIGLVVYLIPSLRHEYLKRREFSWHWPNEGITLYDGLKSCATIESVEALFETNKWEITKKKVETIAKYSFQFARIEFSNDDCSGELWFVQNRLFRVFLRGLKEDSRSTAESSDKRVTIERNGSSAIITDEAVKQEWFRFIAEKM